MTHSADIAGSAALSVIEALLLALNDRKVLPETVIVGVLEVAASTLEAKASKADPANHRAAALIRHIIASRNSVRRP